jgi:ParE toxin of type II toxin-antitoxin system, parDE
LASLNAAVKFTANFELNLDSIKEFWLEQKAPQAFTELLEDLDRTVIGILEQHPFVGRRFFARSPQSLQVRDRVSRLLQRFGNIDVREYLTGDYLILYGVDSDLGTKQQLVTVYLLAIRHHRQLSFDFEGFWRGNRRERC